MNAPDGSGTFAPMASAALIIAAITPDVPPAATWTCLVLSAIASLLTIKKNIR